MDPKINGKTKIFGIIGNPVQHSLSPLLHNYAFRAKNINAAYVPLPLSVEGNITPQNFNTLLNSLGNFGVLGVSVTIPYKILARLSADRVDPISSYAGASNTIVLRKDKVKIFKEGYNTDAYGALVALQEIAGSLENARILLLGYGGSALSIANALLLLGIEKPQKNDVQKNLYYPDQNQKELNIPKIKKGTPSLLVISGRDIEKARKCQEELKKKHTNTTVKIEVEAVSELRPENFDIIINTTPLGMQTQEIKKEKSSFTFHNSHSVLSEDFLKKINNKHYVFDIVYTPMQTPLLSRATAQGARGIEGYRMLLYQAVLQFHLFTGHEAPIYEMKKILKEALYRSFA